MQYILSEEEMAEVRQLRADLSNLSKILPKIDKLQKICTKAANEWPIKYWGNEEAQPWGCILTSEYEHYCDKCPVIEICPFPHKDFSK